MDHETLCIIWYCLLGILLAGYAILDGFDLGVGILHLLVARNDTDRRVFMNAIGPLWDGNEVWLVTFGGALFAAFPEAYATVFSGFYVAFMALLFALILRAVSMEFRSKVQHPGWRRVWDVLFAVGSTLATFLFGVAVGNAMIGVPLDEMHEFSGTLSDQLNLYTVLVGALAVSMFAMHGSIFLYFKTEGDLQARLVPWMWRTFGVFLVLYLTVTLFTLSSVPHAAAIFKKSGIAWTVPVLNVLAIANIPRAIFRGRPAYAFISSCCVIAAFVFLLGEALFPNLVTASNDPGLSLTIWPGSAPSSAGTLKIMLIIAVVGIPCVLVYTASVYWTFRGKVKLDETSY